MNEHNKITSVEEHLPVTSEDNLNPIPPDKRILGKWSYLFAWLGGCISIGTFALGSSVSEKGLNLLQAGVAMIIGSLILIVGLVLIDQFGYKTGSPYVYQLKSAFGSKGTMVPAYIRAVPAIVWYGVQSWLAGTALNEVSETLFGYSNVVLFFILFQLLQLSLSLLGFHGIKWLENIGAVFIISALIYMMIHTMQHHGDIITTKLINVEGTWGLPFYGQIVAFFGVNIPVMLNSGDYARELKTGYSTGTRGGLYFMAMVPATVFMGLIGLTISTATGIANPIVAFSKATDNKFLVVVTLSFIIFAQMTTNLLSNVVPPTYVLMDSFGLSHKVSAILVSLLAVATFPWRLATEQSAAGINIFVTTYTAFFGPIAAIMIMDYFVMRKKEVDLDLLYDPNGPYKGTNPAAMIALFVGAAIGLASGSLSVLVSFFPTMLIYFLLMKHMKKAKSFRKGTILESK